MAKYNQKIVKSLCEKLADGITKKDAATLCGIDEATFHRWMNTKSEFRKSVELAEAEYVEKMTRVVNVKSKTEKTGRLALDILARRRYQDWGEKKLIEGDLNINIIVDESLRKKPE